MSNDAWRPFEPCKENVRKAREHMFDAFYARQLDEFVQYCAHQPSYPELKNTRLIPFKGEF